MPPQPSPLRPMLTAAAADPRRRVCLAPSRAFCANAGAFAPPSTDDAPALPAAVQHSKCDSCL
eukprot:10118825-Alexandrium_andersonii.AAC.1